MSAPLREGDFAIVIPSRCLGPIGESWIGQQVHIDMEIPAQRLPVLLVHPSGSPAPIYGVTLPDGKCGTICAHCLKRVDDGEQPASFEAIEQLTGWTRPAVQAVRS